MADLALRRPAKRRCLFDTCECTPEHCADQDECCRAQAVCCLQRDEVAVAAPAACKSGCSGSCCATTAVVTAAALPKSSSGGGCCSSKKAAAAELAPKSSACATKPSAPDNPKCSTDVAAAMVVQPKSCSSSCSSSCCAPPLVPVAEVLPTTAAQSNNNVARGGCCSSSGTSRTSEPAATMGCATDCSGKCCAVAGKSEQRVAAVATATTTAADSCCPSTKQAGCSSSSSSSSTTAVPRQLPGAAQSTSGCANDDCCAAPETALLLDHSQTTATAATANQLLLDVQATEPLLLHVDGMTCTDCAAKAERLLLAAPGVYQVQVSFLTRKAEVQFNSDVVTDGGKHLAAVLTQAGFPSKVVERPPPNSIVVRAAAADGDDNLQRLSELHGVIEAVVLSDDVGCRVVYDPQLLTPRRLVQLAREQLGLELAVVTEMRGAAIAEAAGEETAAWLRRLAVSAALCLPVVLLAWLLPSLVARPPEWVDVAEAVLAGGILAYAGWPIFRAAYLALVYSRTATMDTLVSLSTLAAYGYSLVVLALVAGGWVSATTTPTYFETAAVLMTLIVLGRYLEVVAKGRTSRVLLQLAELQPTTALLIGSGSCGGDEQDEEIDAMLVEPGDMLRVLPGSKLATDGEVVSGATDMDESMLTGEAMPVEKTAGATVFGGTVNTGRGMLVVRATRRVQESTLANIYDLVEQAQMSKPDVQRVADRVAAYFVPAILVLTAAVFAVWLWLAARGIVATTGGLPPFTFALMFALSVLVISCPCAIALAVPTAVMVGTGVAAKHGILFKGGAVLEQLHRVRAVVFDKTGTLTLGRPAVTDFALLSTAPLELAHHDELFFYAGSAELASEHLLGKAVADYARASLADRRRRLVEPSDSAVHAGHGLACVVAGRRVRIGKREFVLAGAAPPVRSEADEISTPLELAGKTVVFVALDEQPIGLIALADTAKDDAERVVRHLQQQLGVDVWILSGDNRRTVGALAVQLGIDATRVQAEASPADKAACIRRLQGEGGGRVVAMVGDGINDAVALAQADVGIAVGAGTDVAVQAAGVVLVKDRLWDIVVAMDLSRTVFQRIRLNFGWAFLYNLVGIPLASGALYPLFGILVPPAIAGVSEILSSLPVILFSLLLQRYKAPPEGL